MRAWSRDGTISKDVGLIQYTLSQALIYNAPGEKLIVGHRPPTWMGINEKSPAVAGIASTAQ